MDKDSLQLLLSQGRSLEDIGRRFGKHPSTVSYWLRKYGLGAVNREKHASRGPIERRRLEELVDSGLSITEMARELDRSKATVRHWLARHGLRTLKAEVRRQFRFAKDAGLASVTMRCRHHGETEFGIEGRGYYRCKRCRSESVVRHRRKLKEIIVAEAGGACVICGYDRYIGALQFHHLDPADKRMEISRNGVTLALDALREEARKCVLVCSNCHAEIESGQTVVPDTVADNVVWRDRTTDITEFR